MNKKVTRADARRVLAEHLGKPVEETILLTNEDFNQAATFCRQQGWRLRHDGPSWTCGDRFSELFDQYAFSKTAA